jgi:hypothetical protein
MTEIKLQYSDSFAPSNNLPTDIVYPLVHVIGTAKFLAVNIYLFPSLKFGFPFFHQKIGTQIMSIKAVRLICESS